MNKETMNVHEALAELKIMDSRIEKAMEAEEFVMCNKHSSEKIHGVSVEEQKKRMKSAYQKVRDLIDRENAIKRAVVLSNARTMVTVDGVEYTVAEAIYMKNHGVSHLKEILSKLSSEYASAQAKLQANSGEALERKAENYVLSVIQAQPKDSKLSVDSEAMKTLRKTYLENNAFDIIDPLNAVSVMEELENYINGFEAKIDSALSVSNAITNIEVEY